MRLAKGICVFATVIIASAIFSSAQATKDAQAVTVLNSCLSASGGAQAIGLIQDFTETGSATFNWDTPTSATATLKGRVGSNQFRFDAAVASNTRSWAVGNGLGILVDLDQSRTSFNAQTANSLRSLSLPVLDFAAALADSQAEISFLGVTSDGQSYQVHVQETFDPSIDPNGTMSKATARDYFINVKTSLITSISNTQLLGTPAQSFAERVVFSNYTNVNGVMIPFSLAETLGGQQTWTVQINSASFNTGLTDADFQL